MTQSDIPKRLLGRTGFEATVLGFGAMEIRGSEHHHNGRPIEPGQADKILNLLLDEGINYVDTSIDYGDSEESIGKFIARRRDEYFLATKCGCWVGEAPEGTPAGKRPPHVFTRQNIVNGVDQSLRRLKTDHLDLIQFHQSPSLEELGAEDAIEVLKELQDLGKVRFLGSSSILPDIVDHIDLGAFDVLQIPYSALEREHEEVIAAAHAAGIGVVIRGGVAKGDLGREPVWKRYEEAGLDELADGASRAEFMLRFTISHPGMTTTIVGTMNPDHLIENVASVRKGPLPADIYTETKRRLSTL
ncbi:MAG TPA: aldo/keto reductase [Acidimicrobiales bacterium]|nr:aldo/keto reductase [Acidimicrobiales bacterium]